jgi:hypothetical protein
MFESLFHFQWLIVLAGIIVIFLVLKIIRKIVAVVFSVIFFVIFLIKMGMWH